MEKYGIRTFNSLSFWLLLPRRFDRCKAVPSDVLLSKREFWTHFVPSTSLLPRTVRRAAKMSKRILLPSVFCGACSMPGRNKSKSLSVELHGTLTGIFNHATSNDNVLCRCFWLTQRVPQQVHTSCVCRQGAHVLMTTQQNLVVKVAHLKPIPILPDQIHAAFAKLASYAQVRLLLYVSVNEVNGMVPNSVHTRSSYSLATSKFLGNGNWQLLLKTLWIFCRWCNNCTTGKRNWRRLHMPSWLLLP